MAKNNSRWVEVEAVQTGSTDSTATYKCTVKWIKSSGRLPYYGYCQKDKHLTIRDYKPRHYWGFPKPWTSDIPAYLSPNIRNEKVVNVGDGSLQCKWTNSFSWTDTIHIDRGNQTQGTKTIYVGVTGGNNTDPDFLVTVPLRLTTKAIPSPSTPYISVSIDEPTAQDRRIRLSVSFKNIDNFYSATLTQNPNVILASNKKESFTHTIPITEDMFDKTFTYTVDIIGKDGKKRATYTTNGIYISPSGTGLYLNNPTGIDSVMQATFKNVTNKRIKEVWAKVDGEIRRIDK